MLKRAAPYTLVIVTAIATALALIMLVNRPPAPHPFNQWAAQQKQPLVFAHQGGEGIRPSNTLLAFDHAVQLGADVLDADMHITKDGVLVLMHDETLDRTTNGTGFIRDMTFAEIEKLDAAYRFSADDGKTFPFRGTGVTVPALESLFQKHPNLHYGIEIKQTPPEVAIPFCALIRKYNMQDKVLVSSFRKANMDAFRRTCPEVATSAVEDEVRVIFFAHLAGLHGLVTPAYQSLQIPESGGGFQLLTPQFIAAAHARGLQVQPWTINDEADLRRIMTLGVDGINTDFPDRLLAIRE
jgi:glycerophosphoryl diester phosphodiesterase